jgi:hypothetical protein
VRLTTKSVRLHLDACYIKRAQAEETMINDMRVYTCLPGRLPALFQIAANISDQFLAPTAFSALK